MPSNGDTQKVFNVGGSNVVGLGSFHKSLPHDALGEVDATAFQIACVGMLRQRQRVRIACRRAPAVPRR